jgi:hypothetical protein
MRRTYFDSFPESGWPRVADLERFFLAPKGQEWTYDTGNDGWSLSADGLYGTESLPRLDRVKVHLAMYGNRDLGVYLIYDKWDGRIRKKDGYCSRGDLSRLGEFVRTLHDTPLSVGLFIPFAAAWLAVKEFIETDGELPQSIAWIADSDLPPGTFRDP